MRWLVMLAAWFLAALLSACDPPYSASLTTGYWCSMVSWPWQNHATGVCWYQGELAAPYLLWDESAEYHYDAWHPLGWIQIVPKTLATDCTLPEPPVLLEVG